MNLSYVFKAIASTTYTILKRLTYLALIKTTLVIFIHPVRKTTSLQGVDIRTELLIFNIFFQSENIAFRTSSQ